MHDNPLQAPRRPKHVVATETITRRARATTDRLRQLGRKITSTSTVIPPLPLDHVFVRMIGAKSGLIRDVYLDAIPYHEGIAFIAGRDGPAKRPAWFYNIKANPNVVVVFGTRSWHMTARLATPEERDEIWARGVERDRRLLESWTSGGRDTDAFVLTRDEPINSDPASEGQSWAEQIMQLNNAAAGRNRHPRSTRSSESTNTS